MHDTVSKWCVLLVKTGATKLGNIIMLNLSFFKYGYSEVWIYNDPGHEDVFLKIIKERLSDCAYQTWNDQITNLPKYSFYI